MKLISSSFSKRFAIASASIGIGGASVGMLVPALHNGIALPGSMIVFPFFMITAIGFFFWKFFSGLADQVWDDGNTLLIKIQGQELHIQLSDIVNINYSSMTNPPRATLTLRNETQVGKEIAFIPKRPFSFNPFAKNEILEELITRVDAQRRK